MSEDTWSPVIPDKNENPTVTLWLSEIVSHLIAVGSEKASNPI